MNKRFEDVIRLIVEQRESNDRRFEDIIRLIAEQREDMNTRLAEQREDMNTRLAEQRDEIAKIGRRIYATTALIIAFFGGVITLLGIILANLPAPPAN